MTCSGCRDKVQSLFEKAEGFTQVNVNLDTGIVRLVLDSGLGIHDLENVLSPYPKYSVEEVSDQTHQIPYSNTKSRTWLQTYKPILLIFGYILLTSLLIEWMGQPFQVERWMNHFMAGFFLVFSFFKMLDLPGFASSYSEYDIIARKWANWGYVYAFLEFLLGLFYMIGIYPLAINLFAFLLMSISLIGVLNSVLNKKSIRCACLGSVFNLPMSTVTIFEDGLMIAMSGWMGFRILGIF